MRTIGSVIMSFIALTLVYQILIHMPTDAPASAALPPDLAPPAAEPNMPDIPPILDRGDVYIELPFDIHPWRRPLPCTDNSLGVMGPVEQWMLPQRGESPDIHRERYCIPTE